MLISRKRWIAMQGALAATLSLSACMGNIPAGEPNSEPFTSQVNPSLILEDLGKFDVDSGKISEKPMELTVHLHYDDTIVFRDEWQTFKKAAEITNISLKGTASPTATNSSEVFRLMLASGNLPDIIHGKKLSLNQAGIDGALIPLDELIEEHAPNVKQFFEEYDWVKSGSLNSDGNLYYLPTVMDGQASMGFFIRQDWLDKLDLPVPKTVDEYYNTLKAFRDGDPNGNGLNDEIPFFTRGLSGPLGLVQLFGARTDWYEQNDQVYYGKYEPEYQVAMENLAKWYAEDLIDKEVYTRGGSAREVLLGDDIGGSTHDWFASTAGFNDRFKEDVPGIEFVPIAPPADVNGVVKEVSSRTLLSGRGWGISSDNKNPVETIKYLDFWYTEEGRRLNNFGVEGIHYDMVDDKPIFKDSVLNGDLPVNQFLNNEGAQILIGYHQDYSYEEQWMNSIASKGIQEYIDNDYLQPNFPALTFLEEELKVVSQKWPAISTYINEMEQKWIMGVEPVNDETFHTYTQSLKSMGMDEIVQIYNTAYEREILKDKVE